MVGVAAIEAVAYPGIALPEGGEHLRQRRHAARLPAADGHLAAKLRLPTGQILPGAVRQLHDLLRPAAQQQAVLRQDDAMIAPLKQLHPQLGLQILYLARQGGLRHMQKLRRVGDVFLAGDHQKIPEHAQFHAILPLRGASYPADFGYRPFSCARFCANCSSKSFCA